MHPEFKYIHSADEGVTIGYRINDTDDTVTYAFSFVNPRDTFSKAIGRSIVEGRIRKGGVSAKTGRERAHTVSLAELGGSTRYKDITPILMDRARNYLLAID